MLAIDSSSIRRTVTRRLGLSEAAAPSGVLSGFGPMGTVCRGIGAMVAVIAIASTMFASTASASTLVTVAEREGIADTYINATAGQTVNVEATSDQIWSGVWFSGWNGPQGWTTQKAANYAYPMPGVPRYSLLAKQAGQKFYVGTGTSFVAPGSGRIYLQINDDVVNNGAGYFRAYVSVG